VSANTTQLYVWKARPLPHTAVTFPAIELVPNYTTWWQR